MLFKVCAQLSLVLLGACEANTNGAAAAGPPPSEAPAAASPAPEPQRPTPPRPEDQARAQGQERRDVYLELTAPRVSYWLGEPVTLVASVVNASSERVDLYPYLHPEFGFLDVRVTGPDGKLRRYDPPVRREGGRGKEPIVLEPGELHSDNVPLFYSVDGWFLTEPGAYAVEARFAPDKAELVAQPVRFEIREPEGESNREAASLAMGPAIARALYDPGGASSPEEIQGLEELVERYPESRLAGYAHLALGRHWNREVYERGTKTVRPPDYKRALRSLELACERIADPLIWTQASIDLAGCYAELGDERAADETAQGALRRFPELARTRVFDRYFEDLRRLHKD